LENSDDDRCHHNPDDERQECKNRRQESVRFDGGDLEPWSVTGGARAATKYGQRDLIGSEHPSAELGKLVELDL
jgi:hypothetical protein